MTYIQALKQIDNYGLRDDESPKELRQAAEIFYKAIEKQMPKKPIKKTIKDAITYTEYYCPTCNEWLSLRLKNHHCKCGQALKWDSDKELVYCKDCKHYEHFDSNGGACYYFGSMMADDDFCSTGEKR